MKPFTQVEVATWRSGKSRTIAHLTWPVDRLADFAELSLESGEDDLDIFHRVALRLPSSRILLLLHYAGNPPGVDVEADWADEPSEALRELIDTVGLPPEIVDWQAGAG